MTFHFEAKETSTTLFSLAKNGGWRDEQKGFS